VIEPEDGGAIAPEQILSHVQGDFAPLPNQPVDPLIARISLVRDSLCGLAAKRISKSMHGPNETRLSRVVAQRAADFVDQTWKIGF
jgi:hypothetical protein